MNQSYDHGSVRASELIRKMGTRAGWLVFNAIVLAVIAAAGAFFRDWIKVHWVGTLIGAGVALVVAVITFFWAYATAISLCEQKIQAERAALEAFRNDVYGDVVLGWLKKHGASHSFFSSQFAAQKLGLPIEHVFASLKFLRDKKFVRDGTQGSEWDFVPTDCILANPYFVRNPIFDQAKEAGTS